MTTSQNEKVIQMIPSAQVHYSQAVKAFRKGKYTAAIDHFKIGISLSKNQQEEIFGRIQLGLMFQHTEEIYESIALFNDLLEQSSTQLSEVYYFQATNYAYIEEYETALSLLETFLELERSDGPLLAEAKEMKEMLEQKLF